MASAYTPGLEVTPCTTLTRIRELPLPGETLVKIGDSVKAGTDVLAAELPGDVEIVRVADRIGLDPLDVMPGMRCSVGDVIERGQVICEVTTFFGLFTSRLESPSEGTVEFITESNAHVGMRQDSKPLRVNAYIDGTISDIDPGKSVTVESTAALIQGIFGVGGERYGTILPLEVTADQEVTAAHIEAISSDLSGAILIGGSHFSVEALKAVAARGASGVVTGSIDAVTLRSYVGYEIGVSITGDEEVPFTLIVTEGFGTLPISARIMDLANKLAGKSASLNGATQVRAGAMRPEIIVPRLDAHNENVTVSGIPRSLEVGTQIRIIRVPYFGLTGTITELPHEPQIIPSGARVRVLNAKLPDGTVVSVPRANVEII